LHGRRKIVNYSMGGEGWRMGDGRLMMEDGRWKMETCPERSEGMGERKI